MHWVDITILIILFISALMAIVRGFVKEFISLATWVVALLVCMTFAAKLAPLLPEIIANPLFKQGLAWFLLFVGTMVCGSLLSFVVTSMVERTGLSHTDRALGLLFGLARGVVIIMALVLLAVFIELNKSNWWQAPKLLPYFETMTAVVVDFMPQNIGDKFEFTATNETAVPASMNLENLDNGAAESNNN